MVIPGLCMGDLQVDMPALHIRLYDFYHDFTAQPIFTSARPPQQRMPLRTVNIVIILQIANMNHAFTTDIFENHIETVFSDPADDPRKDFPYAIRQKFTLFEFYRN